MRHEEDTLQMQCVTWFRLQYPKYEKLLFINHNNPRSKIDGARLKRMGLVSGVPDMTFLHRSVAYFIEFKSSKGKVSPNQKEWQILAASEGFYTLLIRTFDEFKFFIEKIMQNK